MESSPRPEPLAELLSGKNVKIEAQTPETAAERKARILREAEDAAHERARRKATEDHDRRNDFLLFVFSLVVVGTTTACSVLALLFYPTSSAWAAPMLTLIVGALIGYQTGKSQGKKDIS